MVIALASKPGLSSTTTLSIPKAWDSVWFRNLINNQLKGADVRNAVGVNGIVVSGTIASPYATIGFAAPVTIPGPVTINGALTVNGLTTLNAVSAGTSALVLGVSTGIIINANQTSGSGQITAPLQMSIGSSGGDYGYIGYNITTTTTTGSYKYAASDFASRIQFLAGGFSFLTAASGVAGNTITFASRLSISQAGAITIPAPATSVTALTVNSAGTGNFAATLNATGTNTVAVLFINGNAAGVEALRIDTSATTGAGVPTFANNKPGGSTSVAKWLPISCDGVRGYIPVWS